MSSRERPLDRTTDAPGAELLSLTGISKRFGKVLVADRLQLRVGDGEAVGIVGPNGAGKTTLFSMVSGDVAPDDGEIVFGGRTVTRLGAAARCRLGVGRTYQVPRPFENMTVFENVLVAAQYGAGVRGRAAADLALAVLDQTGLLPIANRHAGALTLLQRKRLELARALGGQPRLLLLDEVAGGLTDPEVEELAGIIAALRASGLTIVWIEHVVHVLVRSVDRLLCLAGGAFIADGSPEEVLRDDTVREVYLGGGPELTAVDTAGPGEVAP
ncbi:ABC transporter ATP-binding protein [Rugosimonospora africana]|uniref:ABC transporter ATP-binding protein n=1 Tax=Rugosimonospora africana TaxID=556532 RepID=A0A8J3VQ30_9ACTN|nr:ATP-binding cassette domain-containing protein [Rugosimonospora africana]GIH14577.1 ABC transporter ATP-binding protein [Rugosimonospora africana]